MRFYAFLKKSLAKNFWARVNIKIKILSVLSFIELLSLFLGCPTPKNKMKNE